MRALQCHIKLYMRTLKDRQNVAYSLSDVMCNFDVIRALDFDINKIYIARVTTSNTRTMPSSDRLEIRSIIKFCHTPTATYEKIQVTKGKDSVSRALVFSWHKRFKDGEESIEDRERKGRKI